MKRRSLLLATAQILLCASVALARRPKTGTFIDRKRPTDLRVVSYNVNWGKGSRRHGHQD